MYCAGIIVEDNGGYDFWGNILYNNASDIGVHEFYPEEYHTAPPDVAISAFEKYTAKLQNKALANTFKDIKVPVRCIEADLVPTNFDANLQYMRSLML